jgi:uncharacterized protein (TIGR02466 family)
MFQQDLDAIDDIARHGQIENIFPTPIFWYVRKNADALNARLRDIILEHERTTPSVVKSNQGGWQSPPNFFDWDEPAVAALGRYVTAALNIATARVRVPTNFKIEFELYGWAAINRKGHYNTAHVHPMSTWSGTYYVDVGDERSDAPGALLEFLHPITASPMNFFPGILPSARLVQPENGMIILFPSYLQHSVRMYGGERPRVCVPFNAHLRQAVSGRQQKVYERAVRP